MDFTRINFQNRGGSNTGKPRISAANLSTLQDGIVEGITKAEAAAIRPLVTSLPASPVDGQECYFLADAANGIVWRLRYRAASASAYKWEYVGGAPLFAEIATQQSVGNPAYTDLTTVGPDIVLPLAGDYDVQIGTEFWNTTAGGWAAMSYALGAAAAVDDDRIVAFSAAANQNYTSMRKRRKTGLAAGALIRAKYKGTGPSAVFWGRQMLVQPVRVG